MSNNTKDVATLAAEEIHRRSCILHTHTEYCEAKVLGIASIIRKHQSAEVGAVGEARIESLLAAVYQLPPGSNWPDHFMQQFATQPHAVLTAEEAREVKATIAELVEALDEIADWGDEGANNWLAATGGYGRFDEPASVCIAREALARYRKQGASANG